MASIYIHIPFCRSICSYCDFSKVLYNRDLVIPYLEALESEIDDLYEKEPVETLYIGGGTPSCLSEFALEKLKSILETFEFTEDYEFTFECNIEDIDEGLLQFLKEIGVNRLSIGIESFDEEKLKFMDRRANFDEALDKMNLMRSLGFDNINLDIMYGIPNERLKDLRQDIKKFIKLSPEHISAYSLIIEDHTKCQIEGKENIDPDEEVKMYDYIRDKLKRSGYDHYEISNFSKPGYESKHNLKYWDNEEYYGFGLGASGYIKGFRYENTRNLEKYLEGNYKNDEHLVSRTEMMENEVMLGLRKIKGINLQEFFDKYDVNIQEVFPVTPLVRNRELIYKDGYIFINPKYIYVMNEILLKMI